MKMVDGDENSKWRAGEVGSWLFTDMRLVAEIASVFGSESESAIHGKFGGDGHRGVPISVRRSVPRMQPSKVLGKAPNALCPFFLDWITG